MSQKKEHSETPADYPKQNEPLKQDSQYRTGLKWLGYGVEFMGVIGIFTYGGYRADEMFDTTPWLMVSGMLVALTGMIYLLIKDTSDWRK